MTAVAPRGSITYFEGGSVVRSVAASVAIVTADTIMARVALDHRVADVVMFYLLGVVIVAMRFGYLASLIASVLSVASFDFFFVPPYLSFAVSDKRYVTTFAIMLFVAFVIANLMDRIRRDARRVRRREVRTASLYAMSRELAVASSSADIARVARQHLHHVFESEVTVLLADGAGGLRSSEPPGALEEPDHSNGRLTRLALELIVAGSGAGHHPASCHAATGEELVALRASSGAFGVLVVVPPQPDFFESADHRDLLDMFANQVALAIERARLSEDAQRALFDVQKERLRNALLSSVSHDLRTPLAVVKGAVTALLERGDELSSSRRQEYLETISDEASRLNRLVRNLLNMTSLEAGALRARKQWHPLEEIVGVALDRMDEVLKDRPVRVDVAAEAAIAAFDATLLEQVLINLVENAVRYTPAGSAIDIRTTREDGGVLVEVADRGPGVPPGQEERIFEKFNRAAPPTTGGMGLGLTICRGILTAHGGTIWCENRPDGGAAFRFWLPHETEPPPMDRLPESVGEA
jgi:two-component system sensor histidine kinase KdpD